jgi:hypothetical protein
MENGEATVLRSALEARLANDKVFALVRKSVDF